MNVLWLSWKDIEHPAAGGAEVVSTEIRKRLSADGHSVRLLTSRPAGQVEKANVDGVDIYRIGGRFSVYFKARRYYKKYMSGWADIIIDEMNTIPFFGYSYDNSPSILLNYQLAREVWLYQAAFPISYIGYFIEPFYLRFLSRNKYKATLTESNSTKEDLARYGFKPDNIYIFRIGMDVEPLENIHPKTSISKLIYLGSVRPMKRTLDAIKAFEKSKATLDMLSLDIVGDYRGSYGRKVQNYVLNSRYSRSITLHGKVPLESKKHLLSDADIILVTSLKEGWGLIATEAASQGVPAIAYDADGLRDSVKNGETGLLAKSGDVKDLAEKIITLVNDPSKYEKMRLNALAFSRQFTFDNSYNDFRRYLGIILGEELAKDFNEKKED